MPGAQLPQSFQVCGTYVLMEIMKDCIDRNSLFACMDNISVSLTKSGTTIPANSIDCGDGTWVATFSGVSPGFNYTVNASITDGTNTASNTVETVDVGVPRIVYAPCSGGGRGPITTLLKPGVTAKTAPLAGKHDGSGGSVLAVVQKLARTPQTVSPKHKRVRFNSGPYVRHSEVDVKSATDWELEIDVDFDTFVTLHLKAGNAVRGRTTSQLF
jgi:hypothetical protein